MPRPLRGEVRRAANPLLLAAAFLAGTSPGFSQEIQPDDVALDPNGRLTVRTPAAGTDYFILRRGVSLGTIQRAVGMALGRTVPGVVVDRVPALEEAAFYRLQKVSQDDPLDTDGDGIDDVFELRNASILDPLEKADAVKDPDGDGVSTLEEYRRGTDPRLAVGDRLDSDGDGLSDVEERELGTDPKDPDTDGDGVPDGVEVRAGLDPRDPILPFSGFVGSEPGLAVVVPAEARERAGVGAAPAVWVGVPDLGGLPGTTVRVDATPALSVLLPELGTGIGDLGSTVGSTPALQVTVLRPEPLAARPEVVVVPGVPPAVPGPGEPLGAPGMFSRLDGSPDPVVRAGDGSVPPFAYRPGNDPTGPRIEFPAGAVVAGGESGLTATFAEARLRFGVGSILDTAAPVVLSAGALTLDGLRWEEIAARVPDGAAGVPLRLFGWFPVRWVGGMIAADGLKDVRIWMEPCVPAPPVGCVPIPFPAITPVGIPLDLTGVDGEVRFPLAGEWTLPDGSGSAPVIRAPEGRPIWLTVRADGEISLGGRVEVEFPSDGPRFAADMEWSDGTLRFELAARGLDLGVLESLAGRLPDIPGIAGGIAAGDLVGTAERLRTLAGGLAGLAQAARAGEPSGDVPAGWAGDVAEEAEQLGGPLLAALGELLAAGRTGAAPGRSASPAAAPGVSGELPTRLADLVRQEGQGLNLRTDFRARLESWVRLWRVRQAAGADGLGSADLQDALATELAAAEAALIRRAREPGAIRTLADLRAFSSRLLWVERTRQQVGLPAEALASVLGVVAEVGAAFVAEYLAELGVGPGQFSPPGSAIAAMDRSQVLVRLRDLLRIEQDLQRLGIELPAQPRAEAMAQLALRLSALYRQDIATLTPEAVRASPLVLVRVRRDLGQIEHLVGSGVLPEVPELAPLRDGSDRALLADLAGAAAELTAAPWSPAVLRDVLREVLALAGPSGTEVPAALRGPMASVYGAGQTTVAALVGGAGELGVDELAAVIEGGALSDELGRRLGFGNSPAWRGERLPVLLDALFARSRATGGFDAVRRTSQVLADIALMAAGGGAGGQRSAALQALPEGSAYLVDAAARSVEVLRGMALDQWASTGLRRLAGVLARPADLLLAGQLRVESVGGGAWFDFRRREFRGFFNGDLSLPGAGLGLRVVQAAITSGGVVDLRFAGQAAIPPTDPVVALRVPAGRPLAIRLEPGRPPVLSGGLRLEFQNGMAFAAHARIDDPEYEFGLEAEGLKFGAADRAVRAFLPLAELQPGALPPGDLARLAGYLADLGRVLDPMSGPGTDLRPVRPGGVSDPGPGDGVGAPVRSLAGALRLAAGSPGMFGFETLAAAREAVLATRADLREELRRAAGRVGLSAGGSSGDNGRAGLAAAVDPEALRLERRRVARQLAADARLLVPACEALSALRTAHESTQWLGDRPASELSASEVDGLARALRDGVADLLAGCGSPGGECDGEVVGEVLAALFELERHAACEGRDAGVATLLADAAAVLRQAGYAEAGLGPDGSVADPVRLGGLTDGQLTRALEDVVRAEQAGQQVGGVGTGSFFPAMRNLLGERRERVVGRLLAIRTNPFPAEVLRSAALVDTVLPELLSLHATLQQLGIDGSLGTSVWRVDGSRGALTVEEDYQAVLGLGSTEAGRIAATLSPVVTAEGRLYQAYRRSGVTDAARYGRVVTAAVAALRGAGGAGAGFDTLLARVREVAAADFAVLEDQHQSAGPADSVSEVHRRFLELASVARVLAGTSPGSGPEPGAGRALPAAVGDDMLVRFGGVVVPALLADLERFSAGEPAWWPAADVAETLAVLTAEASGLEELAAGARRAIALVRSQVAALGDRVRAAPPLDPVLPGELRIARAFGSLRFNRVTGFVGTTFGGRLEFPGLDEAHLEIRRATLDSALNFSLDAGLGAWRPVEALVLDSLAVNVVGGPRRPFRFVGDGVGTFRDQQQVGIEVSWRPEVPELRFDARADNLQADRFSDDVVLFGARFGLSVRPGMPGGEVRFGGSAGLMRRDRSVPLPADPALITPALFQLAVTDLQNSLTVGPDGVTELVFLGGTLGLPEWFGPLGLDPELCPVPPDGGRGPRVQINPDNPLRIRVLPTLPVPTTGIEGELRFAGLGVEAPLFPGLQAALCAATLRFPGSGLPYLTNVTGTLRLPTADQTNHLDLIDGAFDLAGLPVGTLRLREDQRLFGLGDAFDLRAIGVGEEGCEATSLTVTPPASGGVLPELRIAGGFRATVGPLVLTDADRPDLRVSGLACGAVTFRPGLEPELALNTVRFEGTFRIGPGGPLLRDGQVGLVGLENLFRLSAERIFVVTVDGVLDGTGTSPAGPSIGFAGSRFEFFAPDRLPRFIPPEAVEFATGPEFFLNDVLPVRVKRFRFAFGDNRLPIDRLFAPENIEMTTSLRVAIPPEDPFIEGDIDNVVLRFTPEGIPVVENVSTVCFGVASLEIPPIRELGGKLCVGGFDQGPAGLWIAGRLGGSYQGYEVIVTLAATMGGVLGECVQVNAGGVGVPLGPTGFLWTGAQAGVSLANSSGDPCQFTTYFRTNALGEIVGFNGPQPGGPALPAMPWADFIASVRRLATQAEAFAGTVPVPDLPPLPARAPAAPAAWAADDWRTAALASLEIDCPGDCPPATVNIFCQPHPDEAEFPQRVIGKFSSIGPEVLDRLGITRAFVQQRAGNVAGLTTDVVALLVAEVGSRLPPAGEPLPPDRAAVLNQIRDEALAALGASFRAVLRPALEQVAAQGAGALYDEVLRTAYAGAPCVDITLMVAGNFSYTGISSFAYVQGKGAVSTAGSAGVMGTLFVAGLPVGEARVFVAATDAAGELNPSLCGQVDFGFGPLDIGLVQLAFECPGCVTEMLGIVPDVAALLAEPLLRDIAARATGRSFAGVSRLTILSALNQPAGTVAGGVGFSGADRMRLLSELTAMGEEFARRLPADFPARLIDILAQRTGAMQPRVVLCGRVEPRLFGFPLVPGGRLAEFKAEYTRSRLAASCEASVGMLLSAYFPVFTPGDSATLSAAWEYGDPYEMLFAGLQGGFGSPARARLLAEKFVNDALANTGIGIEYSFHPLGMQVADAAARVILPNLVDHPERRPAGDPLRWRPPEERPPEDFLPSRRDLLLAATSAGKLGDVVAWKGTRDDLFEAFPDAPEYAQVRQVLRTNSLREAFFPHGGVVGAAQLAPPRALVEGIPPALIATASGSGPVLERFQAVQQIIGDYLLQTRTNGQLTFHLPAPNPPLLYNPEGRLLADPDLSDPQAVLDSILSVAMDQVRVPEHLYRPDLAFLSGYLTGDLLGIPVGRATIDGRLPVGQAEGVLEVRAEVPRVSWFSNFVDQATLTAVLRQRPARPIEETFTDLSNRVRVATTDAARLAVVQDTLARMNDAMPKGSVEARFTNFRLPPGYAGLLGLPAVPANRSDLEFFAYSPFFAPSAAGTGAVADARRFGGLAVRTSVRVAGLVDARNVEFGVRPLPDGSVQLLGTLTVPPIVTPVFRLSGANGGDLVFESGAEGLRLVSSARLEVVGVGVAGNREAAPAASGPMTLPSLNIARNGSFRAPVVPAGTLRIGRFTLASLGGVFLERTVDGVLRLEFSGSLADAPLPSLALSGTLGSDGAVSLAGNAGNAVMAGFPLRDWTGSLTGTAPGAVSLALSGELGLPGLEAVRLSGTFDRPSAAALRFARGPLGNLDFGGFPLEGPEWILDGAGLRATGSLRQGAALLPFAGGLTPAGGFLLTNRITASTYQGFPSGGFTNVLRRGAGDYAAAVLTSAPRAYWRLNDTGGATSTNIVDTIAGGLTGEPVGTVGLRQTEQPLPDKANTSVGFLSIFPGQDSHIRFRQSGGRLHFQRITVEAWIHVGTFTRPWQAIVTKGDSAWRLHRFDQTDRIAFGTSGLSPEAPDLPSTRPLRDNAWHHVVGVYDGRAKYLYVDGVLDAWQPATGTIASNNADIMIGNNAEQPARGWNGYLDEVAVYDRALTADEVLAHYLASDRAGIRVTGAFGFAGAGEAGEFNGLRFGGALSRGGNVALHASTTELRVAAFPMPQASVSMVAGPAVGAVPFLTFEAGLGIPGVFDRNFAGVNGSIDTAGRLNAVAAGPNLGILGFGFRDVQVVLADVALSTLSGSATVSGTLNLPNGFPAVPLSGTVNALGAVNLSRTLDSLSLGGLPLSVGRNATVSLLRNPDRLTVGGGFGTAFGNLDVSGNVSANGTYALTSAAGLSRSIGGRTVSFANALTLANSGLSGSGRVAFGAVNVDVAVSQSAGQGLSVTGSTGFRDADWRYFGPGDGYPAGRLRWNATVAYSGGQLRASVSGTVAGWQRQRVPGNENRPPTGDNWLDAIPNGVFPDTLKINLPAADFTGGDFSYDLPAPFRTSLAALAEGIGRFQFPLSSP